MNIYHYCAKSKMENGIQMVADGVFSAENPIESFEDYLDAKAKIGKTSGFEEFAIESLSKIN